MDKEPQVFTSYITRSSKPLKNDLTDLLKIAPAQPVVQKKYETRNTCDFKPKCDKYYKPKRRSRLKVSTVRDIRNLFQKYVYSTLPVDLEKQQNVLLRKIKAGSSRDENTKSLTRNMFKCDKPVSRSAWQMLTNLNPEEYAHSTQFVLWNGKSIRVNGSKGGSCKFMCKYDLGANRFPKTGKSSSTWKPLMKKKGLLQNSLSVNFKPGPLRKKQFLDHSYQKYHVGGIEIQNLPKPALEIHPTVGKIMDPTLSRFLHNTQQGDGTITEKWAEFSVSVLATIENETVTQIENECCVTFDLDYKCNQQRILMRRDVNSKFASTPHTNIIGDDNCDTVENFGVTSEIQSVIDGIIDSVEISLEQDNIYTVEEEPRDVKLEEQNTNVTNIQPKELRPRLKRDFDRTRELERLDVTIIRLAESVDKKPTDNCPKAYCSMGCVCQSLESWYNFKRHCGRIECMFGCKCDFSKYKVVDSHERDCSDLLPGLIKLDSEMSSKMAKEEQKFHHTVIVTPENSVLLKSKKRDWKSSRKYADFFSSMSLKNDCKPEKVAVLVLEKLNLTNVEPWCMVHGLYKCFCKGIFTDFSIADVKTDENMEMNSVQQHTASSDLTDNEEKTNNTFNVKTRMSSHRTVSDRDYDNHPSSVNPVVHRDGLVMHQYISRSARVKPYRGRKFTNGYYFNANRKISKMEEHDDSLRKRLIHLYSVSTGETGSLNNKVSSAPAPTLPTPVQTGSLNKKVSSAPAQTLPTPVQTGSLNKKVSSAPAPTLPTPVQTGSLNKKVSSAPAQTLPTPVQTRSLNKRVSSAPAQTLPTPVQTRSLNKKVSSAPAQTLLTGLPPLPPLTSAPTVQINEAGGTSTKESTTIKLYTNRLPNKEMLVAWLEMSYKQYKQRIDQGILKIYLEPPDFGKMGLYPWDFILGRYRDKKNLFLITPKLPYRIFMAVDPKDPFFRQCININDIHFADLPKYPLTVKHLLANAKDLKDNFCILWGLSHCWELIGSVAKVSQPQETTESIQLSAGEQKNDFSEMSSDTFHVDSENSNTTTASTSLAQYHEEETMNSDKSFDNDKDMSLYDSSRWFVMTVENDFDEIQFYNKGFFVKLESIIKAINVARASKKTVRLSSQKCVDSTGPQFGIYAIPNENESCVFVGPYEKNEPLGIETVKTISDIRKQKRTSGVWITTKKLENFNVIDDPLSFMPSKDVADTEMMTLAGDANTEKNTNGFVETSKRKKDAMGLNAENYNSGMTKPKILKPIKIAKTNSFYQLAPNGTLKPISQQRINEQIQTQASTKITPKVINTSLLKLSESTYAPLLSNTSTLLKCIPSTKIVTISKRPVAEIAPHVKQSHKSSISTANSKDVSPKKEKGMFILKPEEINKRLMQIQMPTNLEQLTAPEHGSDMIIDDIEMDIENFLATAVECEAPNDDVLIISDDDMDLHKEKKLWKDVWIECKTIEGLGWVRGRKNNEGLVSFEFPGFKYTEFYMHEEAFAKLNQVLSRKIYIPKSIALEWHVVESEEDLSAQHMLTQEELGPDFVMTKRGIRHTQELMIIKSSKKGAAEESEPRNLQTEENEPFDDVDEVMTKRGIRHTQELMITKSSKKGAAEESEPRNLQTEENEPCDDLDERMDIAGLEAESQLLEEEGEVLFNTFKSNVSHTVIGQGLKELDSLREEIAARLQRMVSDN